jgi:arylsulfatase A-like enzyme
MARRPNVLILLTDQQRRDSLSCYGNPIARTPNLDRLAEEGTRFDRAYVANPICMPNRLSLVTGMYPRNHGIWTNGLLVPPRPTVADWLGAAGYQSAWFGKVHFEPFGGHEGSAESGRRWQVRGDGFDWTGPYWGFDHVELVLGHYQALAHYGRWFRRRGGTEEMMRIDRRRSVRDVPFDLHPSTFVAERTEAYLREMRDEDRPFLAVASFPDPHHPFDPPAELADAYDPQSMPDPIGGPEDLATRPEHYRQHFEGRWHRSGLRDEAAHPDGIDRADQRVRIARTAAMVEGIDRGVGRILAALEAEGLAEETLVFFTADHGELLGDHGLWMKGPFFYEGLVNVPLIARGPGVASGQLSASLASTIDIAPTICQAAGLDRPIDCNGVSLSPVLAEASARVRDACIVEYRNGYGQQDVCSKTLVTDRWKYTRYQTGQEELTDLVEDPSETRNVAGNEACRGQVERLRARLLDELLATEAQGPEQISHA